MPAKLAIHGGRPVRESDYPIWPVSGPREEDLVRKVLFSPQWGGYHEFVGEFEQLFAGLHDATYGVSAANGTLALELMFMAAGIGPGDEIIVPAHSFIASATAVSRVGATPVFVDIDRDTFNIDPREAEKAIGAKTRGILVVHFGGLVADMDDFQRIAKNFKIQLFEDAAHAHGAEWNGGRAGGFGRAATFSFQNSKAMTAGEGGILITSDEELAEKARSLANGGRQPDKGWFEHFELGTNFRLTGLQAAVLMGQLDRLPEQIRTRSDNRKALDENHSAPGVQFQAWPDAATVHTHYILPGRVDEAEFGCSRDEFIEAMQAEGIPVRPFYPHTLQKNPLYRTTPKRALPCPVAEQACKDSFWLPQRVFLGSEADTLDVTTAIRKIYEVYKPPKKQTVQ